jgi:adenine-specific DNA-methyltransferase
MKPKTYKSTSGVNKWLQDAAHGTAAVFAGDCERLMRAMPAESTDLILTSPPYCMGKEYEARARDLERFVASHDKILPLAVALLKPGGSLCWQVGYHIERGVCTPLDFLVMQAMLKHPEMVLRNRIAWTFGHGLHCTTRFSGRHETILWFTKGKQHDFDLDAIRVAQKYPGKSHSTGPKKGKPSGNPLGKNPGDVWDIPNVKANHVEKTDHPCQFPVGLAQRLVRALTRKGDIVFDPFSGVASTGVAAVTEGRRFLGAEIESSYLEIGQKRLVSAIAGKLDFRPADRAVHVPNPESKLVQRPPGFAIPS